MEENERLRAILGEWSTRAAKVLIFSARHMNPSFSRFMKFEQRLWIFRVA